MIFLIEYDRRKGRLVHLDRFQGTYRVKAETTRLEKELDLRRKGLHHEVVLLEATSEEALRLTHRRYFEDLHQITTSSSESVYLKKL